MADKTNKVKELKNHDDNLLKEKQEITIKNEQVLNLISKFNGNKQDIENNLNKTNINDIDE